MPRQVQQTVKTPVKTSSPVKRKTASRGSVPQVKKMPRGSRERKVVEQVGAKPKFWEEVKAKYFR